MSDMVRTVLFAPGFDSKNWQKRYDLPAWEDILRSKQVKISIDWSIGSGWSVIIYNWAGDRIVQTFVGRTYHEVVFAETMDWVLS